MERKNRRNFIVYESSVSYRSSMYKSVLQIRMQGKCLEELGFAIGSEINVECLYGKLIITKKEAIADSIEKSCWRCLAAFLLNIFNNI